MTPLEFFQYSLMAVVDVFILLFFIGVTRGLLLGLVKVWIKFYFAEQEAMYKRMADVPTPFDIHSRMH